MKTNLRLFRAWMVYVVTLGLNVAGMRIEAEAKTTSERSDNDPVFPDRDPTIPE